MKNIRPICLSACFMLAACNGGPSVLSMKAGTCYADRNSAEIVNPTTQQTVWQTTGGAVSKEAGLQWKSRYVPDNHPDKITVNFKERVCFVGNPYSEGSLPYALVGKPQDRFPAI